MWLSGEKDVLVNTAQCASIEWLEEEDNPDRYCIIATTFDGREYFLVRNSDQGHAQATFNDIEDLLKAEQVGL